MRAVTPTRYKFYDYGLITPSGKFFSCGYCDHCDLESKLIDEGELDDNDMREYSGAIHVSSGHVDLYNGIKINQAQMDTAFDYTVAHGRSINFDDYNVEIV